MKFQSNRLVWLYLCGSI